MLSYTFQQQHHGNGSYDSQNWSELEYALLPTQLYNQYGTQNIYTIVLFQGILSMKVAVDE